jgi:hypothetical protein
LEGTGSGIQLEARVCRLQQLVLLDPTVSASDEEKCHCHPEDI